MNIGIVRRLASFTTKQSYEHTSETVHPPTVTTNPPECEQKTDELDLPLVKEANAQALFLNEAKRIWRKSLSE